MLKFISQYPQPLSVSIMWYTPNCPDGGDWTKKGWWNLAPGEGKVVHGADLDDVNRYWCYFAQAADGAFWAGDIARMVPPEKFEWCEWTSSTDATQIGYRLQDVGDADDFTITLTP
ncbi:DUF1036 domain-containing protein [Streptomyces sp. NPDC006476]|jgi:uncharacterized membrane protein|uniref:DUF1036 domain-containing protein n=1 Tax=Streptomyces sp. NPDC006476 TaxID=3157175 RepID=UPI0033A0C45E